MKCVSKNIAPVTLCMILSLQPYVAQAIVKYDGKSFFAIEESEVVKMIRIGGDESENGGNGGNGDNSPGGNGGSGGHNGSGNESGNHSGNNNGTGNGNGSDNE